jgi:N-acyl-phosphatidylethanolamine-hydrolysing phospholipase D
MIRPTDERKSHHAPNGRFHASWPLPDGARGFRDFLRWRLERMRTGAVANPPQGQLELIASNIAEPRAATAETRLTWIGHATFLMQVGGANLLTDPVWSERVSPVHWAGPRRIMPPGLAFERLPPLDGVLLSHDHFDHLDRPTVHRIVERFGADVPWFTPLRYAGWLGARGVRRVVELDWWDSAPLDDNNGVRITGLPAQHWTQRSPGTRNARLWCSFAIDVQDGARVYFGGDSGWFGGYADIRNACGPFDAVVLPIGAYAPRWFMRPYHMTPEEAVAAWLALGARGVMVPMHWGTFVLSDEPVLEPPARLAAEWRTRALPEKWLRIPRHGETVSIAAGASG